jgi:lysophospholipase L1-like esterase
MKTPVAAALAGLSAALLALAGSMVAAEGQRCEVPDYLLFGNNELKHVTEAVKKDRRLTIAVVGTGSSILAGPDGPLSAYPARLEEALKRRLPSVAVKVVTLVRTRMSAEDLARGMAKLLVDEKPDLVIWQTGTLDAIRRIEPDDFRAALEEGVETLHKGGADVILMNMQYSPRTDAMLDVGPLADVMRFVAQQHGALLFDRLGLMRSWNDSGTFDLYAATKNYDMARKVHECIGWALATQIISAGHLGALRMQTTR